MGIATLAIGCASSAITDSSATFDGTPYLGIQYVESADGIAVVDVFPDSPAHRAGILPGDTILSVDGRRIYGVFSLREIIRSKRTGERIDIEIKKSGAGTRTLSIQLEKIPERYFE